MLFSLLLNSFVISAQVQVSKEPRHKKMRENKYIRLLDVRIPPGDTTQFHIHSTPSLFLEFTNTSVCVQIKGQGWVTSQNIAGSAAYRSFLNDTLVHRVSNCDTVPFHVIDIEILSSYNSKRHFTPLPFTQLFENEKAAAYQLTDSSFTKHLISGRGPMVAELVEGNEVIFHNTRNKKSTSIKRGKYLYIKPGSSFYFSAKENEKIDLVLFEIK
jgi:quercetin dioxygenase-like cupin family protein